MNVLKINNRGEIINPINNKLCLDHFGHIMAINNNYFNNDEDFNIENINYRNSDYNNVQFKNRKDINTVSINTAPTIIRFYTIIFILLVFAGIGFLVYEGKTETENSDYKSLNRKSILLDNLIGSDKQSSDYYVESSVNKKIDALDGALIDSKLNVIYIQIEKGKLVIQESIWHSKTAAKDRLISIISQPSFNNLNDYISQSTKYKNLYRVILGNFDSIDKAKESTKKIRGVFKS